MDPNEQIRQDAEAGVGRPIDPASVDRTMAGESHSSLGTFVSENKLLLGVTLAGAVVVGVILSLALNSWVFLVLAVLVHGLASALVVSMTMRMAGSGDKPDPRTVARLEEEGIGDPERALNDVERSARQQS